MCPNLGLHLVLLFTAAVLVTGEETRSRGKVPGPPEDGDAVPDLHNVVQPDPCNPGPCGINANCFVNYNRESCSCFPGYYGNPYVECRPECTINSDCPKYLECVNIKCHDPCRDRYPGVCGINAICNMVNHKAQCTCPRGYTGDPVQECCHGLDDCTNDKNFNPSCTSRTESGECERNPGVTKCCFGCNLSGLDDCTNDKNFNPSCTSRTESGECERNPGVTKCCFGCNLSGELWRASCRGNLSEVNTALAAGANSLHPNMFTQKGDTFYSRTAIHVAARANHPGVVKALLDAGVDVNLQTTGAYHKGAGVTPTHEASGNGSIDALDILIEYKADVNLPDSDGKTPLMYAVREGHQDVALFLIEYNADVNLTGFYGVTPLMLAAGHGHLGAAKVLINANASLDVTSKWDGTALHHAARNNNQDVALLLLQSGADTQIRNNRDGYTPLDQALSREYNQLAELIESYTNTGGGSTGA